MPQTPVFSTAAVAAPHHLGSQPRPARPFWPRAAMRSRQWSPWRRPSRSSTSHERPRRRRLLARARARGAASMPSTPRGGGRARHHQALPGQGLRRRPAARSRFALTVAGAVGGWAWRSNSPAPLAAGCLSTSCCPTRSASLARDMPSPAAEARFKTSEEAALFAAPALPRPSSSRASACRPARPPGASARRYPGPARPCRPGRFLPWRCGREIAADLERIESPIIRKDLETYRARVVKPLELRLGHSTGLQPSAADAGPGDPADPRDVRAPCS